MKLKLSGVIVELHAYFSMLKIKIKRGARRITLLQAHQSVSNDCRRDTVDPGISIVLITVYII